MKYLQSLLAGLFMVGLAACSTKGPAALSAASLAPLPAQGKVQLVLYYPSSSFWLGEKAHVEINTQSESCDLKADSYFIKEMAPAPKTRINASLCGRPGVSQLAIRTVAGKRYYIRVIPNDNTLTGRIGNYGMAKPKEKLTYGGPFRLDIMDETAALRELQALKPCARCE